MLAIKITPSIIEKAEFIPYKTKYSRVCLHPKKLHTILDVNKSSVIPDALSHAKTVLPRVLYFQE